MSRPSAIFLLGGQIVAMLKATSSTISVIASRRFRRPRSVAKYQPKRTSRPRPRKNVSAGVILPNLSTFSRLDHVRNRRFFHLDLHVVGHLHNDSGLFHVRDQAVNAAVCHDAVAGL